MLKEKIRQYLNRANRVLNLIMFGEYERFERLTEFSPEGNVLIELGSYVFPNNERISSRYVPLSKDLSKKVRGMPFYQLRMKQEKEKVKEHLKGLSGFADKVHALSGTNLSATQ